MQQPCQRRGPGWHGSCNTRNASIDPGAGIWDNARDSLNKGPHGAGRMTVYLRSYSTKAQDVCHWPAFARDALVFGAELEMEPRGHSSQSALCRAMGEDESQFFIKSDGSLDAGVEMVTVPLTLDQHRAFDWRGKMRPLLAIAMSGSRTSNCGMHVHVNRRALSPLTLAKMLLFMNAPGTQHLIGTVAQRTGSTWARPQRKTWKEGKEWQRYNHMRYQPLNVTGPTAEFRIFRGSLRYDRILKNLEFCHAVVMFCRGTSAAKIQDAAEFAAWLDRNGREYPYLVAFLSEVGYNDGAAQ